MRNSRNSRRAIRARAGRIRNTLFLAVLLVFGVIGLVVTARPKTSVVEKRDLAEFPSFSLKGLVDGSWFSGLTTWYADTYPLREGMISTEARLENLYGVRNQKLIVNNAGNTGETIPDADSVGAAGVMEIPSASEGTDAGSTGGGASGSGTGDAGLYGNAGAAGSGTESGMAADASGSGDSGNPSAEELDENAADGAIKDQPEAVGSIYIADGCGFGVYYFNQEAIDSYASMVNTVAQQFGSSAQVYTIPTPDNYGIMLDRSIQESLSQYEGDAFDYLYKRFSDDVKVVQTFNTLQNHNSEYIYFHTDHHWTALGAYYAYVQFCRMKGFEPHEVSQFQEQVSEGFLGSFYSYSNHSPELAANPDTIHAYIPMSTNSMQMMTHGGQIMDYMIIQPGNSYDVFIGSDEPWEEIDNPDISDGSACVVIKDSYGNAFVPWLVDHYDKVFVIDYRYYTQDLTQMIRDEGIDDIIFLNNIEFLSADTAQKCLGLFHFENHQ